MLGERLAEQFSTVYGPAAADLDVDLWVNRLLAALRLHADQALAEPHVNHWDETDIALITYGDSVLSDDFKPLEALHYFLNRYLRHSISWVHVLPFHPWTSDDGFSVLDYSSVNESLGDWSDITRLGIDYRLMADLVLNHCSIRSAWFENFRQGVEPGKDYFFSADKTFDISKVVRPRTSPLLQQIETAQGPRSVWCTFSHDQVDFDFTNPAVLLEFAKIIRQQLDAGVRVFRLDAVAFLWKESGSSCINLSQTHGIIRLLRTLIESAQADGIVITETNIPNVENLSYFGNANEAHGIYNFSLPPLLVHGLLEGTSKHLSHWLTTMPPAQDGTTYFNFIASHDGIGLRPAEGILANDDIASLIEAVEARGGVISSREAEHGTQRPYELNISLFDLLTTNSDGKLDHWGFDRFICAHAIMLGLEGIPAFYIHSLLATGNDIAKMQNSAQNRAINRHQWQLEALSAAIEDSHSSQHRALHALEALIARRKKQAAFHPNATQFTLRLGESLLGFWRQSSNRQQSIFCLHNMTNTPQILSLAALNLITTDSWYDLISDEYISTDQAHLQFKPYQSYWLTNL